MSHSLSNSLHGLSSGVGQPASYRDASNNTRTSNGPWKSSPTIIMTPTNANNRPPNTHPRGTNPFSTNRMSTTLPSRGRTKDKHPANQVLFKRTSHFFPGTNISENPTGTADIIHVIDDSEDVGQPLMQRSSPPRSSVPSPSRVTRAESTDPIDLIQTSDKERVTAKDGESTQRLAHKLKAQTVRKGSDSDVTPRNYIKVPSDDDEDEIEDASDFDDMPLPPPPPKRTARSSPQPTRGRVNQMIAQIEGMRQKSVEEKQSDSPSVRMINFNAPGVKAKMKPRTQKLEFQSIEAQATVSAGYTTSPRPSSLAASSSRRRFELPLEAHIYGKSSRPSRKDGLSGWLYLEGSNLSLCKSRGSTSKPEFSVDVNGFFQDMQYTTTPYDESKPVILKLDTHKSTDKNPHVRLSGFVHGSRGHDGSMTFKFNTSHAEWDSKHYTGLIQALGSSIKGRSSLNEHSSPRAWQMACNFAEEEVISDTDSSSPKRPKSDDLPSTSTSTRQDKDLQATTSKSAEEHAEINTRTRIRPRPVANTTLPYIRRSTRSTAVTRISPQPDTDEIILVYPPNGTGAVNITNTDLKRLAPGQYLNDTLIEFALKLWLNDLREKDPKLAEQIHIFSSFFYKKIQVKNKEEGYSSVRKWTSKFDLFKKKYIVVPINENLHWYLAIICNPEFVLQPPPPSTTTISSVQTRKRKRDSDALEQESSTTLPELSDRAHDSPTATADDETSVENLLNESHISQLNGSTEGLAMPVSGDSLLDDFVGELQYPESDGVPGESSTDLGGPSRERSEPIMIDDDAMDVDVDDPNEASTSAVPCTSFYASGSKMTKEPEDVLMSPEVPWNGLSTAPVNADVPDLDLENEEPVAVESSDYKSDKTYIFTFDSLGGKHPGAIRNLGQYLQMEAKDKKGLDTSQTTLPSGQNALVPAQPNYCDCGVYLIHFVQKFMSDPVKFSKKIVTKKAKDYDSKERELDWEADVVSSLRDILHVRALSLSEQWKKEKAVKEESKKQKEAAEAARNSSKLGPEAEVIPDSDDEEIVVTGVRAATKKGGKGRQSAAYRLR